MLIFSCYSNTACNQIFKVKLVDLSFDIGLTPPKAINTVLAFVSSKRQLATSFSSVRSLVENLLKQ